MEQYPFLVLPQSMSRAHVCTLVDTDTVETDLSSTFFSRCAERPTSNILCSGMGRIE